VQFDTPVMPQIVVEMVSANVLLIDTNESPDRSDPSESKPVTVKMRSC
jgi:hypothetical protein